MRPFVWGERDEGSYDLTLGVQVQDGPADGQLYLLRAHPGPTLTTVLTTIGPWELGWQMLGPGPCSCLTFQ